MVVSVVTKKWIRLSGNEIRCSKAIGDFTALKSTAFVAGK
jgi:hypothetical protein